MNIDKEIREDVERQREQVERSLALEMKHLLDTQARIEVLQERQAALAGWLAKNGGGA